MGLRIAALPAAIAVAVLGFNLVGDGLRDFLDPRLAEAIAELADHVLAHGGRFYYAKDSVLTAEQFRANHAPGAIEQFLALKARVDPKNVLQTDQWRRLTTPGKGSSLLARAG